jgi:hypothetical protein
MRVVKVLGDFFFDLIIGDDPKIAVAVAVSLLVAAVVLLATAVPGSVVVVAGAVIVVLAFTVVLVVDTRTPGR